jgi:predicted phage baseplate assembly protein
MSEPCGCCAGTEIVTPARANPPGLAAIGYRAGTHATFLESMLARLANLAIELPSADGSDKTLIYPLQQLTTRDPADPTIALLDAWAMVADVLTFYQERIANEGYLMTALERRSVLELARLVGYRLRPGLSASVYLAFTVTPGFAGALPTGTRAQSIPGAGEKPQFFETSDALDARDVWNAIKPRLTRPTMVSLVGAKLVTDVDVLDTIYLAGTSTNLNVNDPLLFVLGNGSGLQAMRSAEAVDAQAGDKRTQVTFVPVSGKSSLALFALKAEQLFPGSVLAGEVAAVLQAYLDEGKNTSGQTISAAAALAMLREKQALAESRNFTRLGALIRHAAEALRDIAGDEMPPFETLAAAPLVGLLAITKPLGLAASVQPANAIRLGRSVAKSFSPLSDLAPRLVGVLKPATAPFLYRAWTNVVKVPDRLETHALRVRATLFASTYSGPPKVTTDDDGVSTTSFDNPPSILSAWRPLFGTGIVPPSAIALDAIYDRIKPGSWVVIDRPPDVANGERVVTYHKVTATRASTMDTGTGFAAKVTVLTLQPQWLSDVTNQGLLRSLRISTPLLRDTIVYAQSEPLALAEEPLDADVAGETVDLPSVLDGLEAGRWLIVSGQRTDVPGVSGVNASELVMLAGVTQGTDATFGKADVSVDLGKLHTRLQFATPLAYSYEAKSVVIYGNVAKATHGQTVGEVLGDGDGSKPFQTFALRQSPLTYVSAPTVSGVESALSVRVNDIKWHELESFVAAGRRDRSFITRADDEDKTTVTFGNGARGARVPTGTANLKAVYRYGIGKSGNVQAGQISQLATRPLGAQEVINPLRASGGANSDSADQARRNTPLAVMALDRLVSVRDYADFARTYAGIAKASAARLSDGRRQQINLTVAGVDDIPIDEESDLYRNLLASLETFGDPHLPVAFAMRHLKLLVISAGVAVLPDYLWESVEPQVRAAVLAHFSFDARDLGQSAFLSEAIGVMQAVEGIAYVDVDTFDAVAEDVDAAKLATLGTALTLNQYVVAELARPAGAPGAFEEILPAELVFMTPDVPDTLILNQIGA